LLALFPVSSSLATFSSARAKLIGKGLTADVYECGEGRLLKLFFGAVTREHAEWEFRVTKAVRDAGIAAPAAYELAEVEGRLGIVFERLRGTTLYREVQSKPWKLFWAAQLLGRLHATLHQHRAPEWFPRQREQIEHWMSLAPISEERRAEIRAGYAAIPEGDRICHGDFHPENVFITPEGAAIIDWTTATRGNPASDVARTSALFEQAELPEDTPSYMKLLFKASRHTLHRVYLNSYFKVRPELRPEFEQWRPAQLAAGWRWPGARV
jgi:Ser/Thr protein kinase RdoA (MazF antagonist)